jgi:hypothetical protein
VNLFFFFFFLFLFFSSFFSFSFSFFFSFFLFSFDWIELSLFSSFQIFFDLDGRPKTKDLGEVSNAVKGPDDLKSLDEIRFVTGDFLDVAIHKEGKRFAAERPPHKRGDREDDRNRDVRDRKDSRELDWDKAKDRTRDDRDRDRDRDYRDRDRGRGGRRDGRR